MAARRKARTVKRPAAFVRRERRKAERPTRRHRIWVAIRRDAPQIFVAAQTRKVARDAAAASNAQRRKVGLENVKARWVVRSAVVTL